MTDRIGQQFGKYRLIRLLGKGGFAEVYLGERVDIGMYAAIKIVLSQLHGDEEKLFREEAHTLARLVHPHIVRLLDYDVANGIPFLVMDYAPHGSLRQRHPLNTLVPLDKVVSYTQQIAGALYYAHNHGLVHRDVKPENMMLDQSDEVLLSDFGIARSTAHSSTMNVSGTLHYMAPEQLTGKVYPQSDQYALGIVVYEWLSGSSFFTSTMQMQEIIAHILTSSPPPLRQKASFITPAVEQVVMRALEREPKQRFDNINTFAEALKQAATNAPRPVYTPPATPVARGPVSSVPSLPIVDSKQLIWPTFALSTAQRQEIACGKMTLVPLRTTSKIMNTQPRALPVAQIKIQPKTDTLDNLLRTGTIVHRTTALVSPNADVQKIVSSAPIKQGTASIARTTGSKPVSQPQPSNTSSTPIVQRSTANQPSSSQPSSSQPSSSSASPAPARQGTTSYNGGAWSFFGISTLLALVSIGLINNHNNMNLSAFNIVEAFAYIAAGLAFILGIASFRNQNVADSTANRRVAGWCITLAIAIIVLEIFLASYLYSNLGAYYISG